VLLRGIRAHLLTSLATLALAFVVATGSVAVVGASRIGGTPGAVAAMLALYGAVALAEQSARSTADRSHDVALARLRGLSGGRLVLFAAGPLLTVSLIGVAAGAGAGIWFAGRILDAWGRTYSLDTREVVVAVALLAGAWVTIVLVAGSVIRRPLLDALSVNPRRRASSWVTTFLELLVVAGAILAVYEAHRGGHGWVPIVAPALVALAAGQVVMWLLALTPRLGGRLGLSLTTHRLRRDPDPASVVRVLVAAAVLLAVTLTGGAAAADWRDDAARLRAGGPTAVPFPEGALRAYAAAHDADPKGQWLMAAVAVDDLTPKTRRVFVDSARWDAVVGDFVDGTSVAGATSHMSDLADQPGPVLVRADALQAEVSGLQPGATGVLAVAYLGDEGFPRTARLRFDANGPVSGDLAACRVGCSLIAMTVRGTGAFTVDQVTAGPTVLLRTVSYDGLGSVRPVVLSRPTGLPPQKALSTPDVTLGARVDGIDGTTHEVDVTGTVGAVPFLGRSGSLLDLPRVLRGAVGTVAGATAVVVARADTPAAVLATLQRDGGRKPTTYAAMARSLDLTPQARADDLALWVAVGVGLVALTHLAAWLAGQAGRRRTEVAGLRAAGIGPRTVRRAYLLEAVLLAVIVLVTAAVTVAATTMTLLEPMELVGGWANAPAVDLALRPWTVGVVLVGVAIVTAVTCATVFTRFGRNARPSALRAAER